MTRVRRIGDVVSIYDQRRKVAASHCFRWNREDLWFRDVVFQSLVGDERRTFDPDRCTCLADRLDH